MLTLNLPFTVQTLDYILCHVADLAATALLNLIYETTSKFSQVIQPPRPLNRPFELNDEGDTRICCLRTPDYHLAIARSPGPATGTANPGAATTVLLASDQRSPKMDEQACRL